MLSLAACRSSSDRLAAAEWPAPPYVEPSDAAAERLERRLQEIGSRTETRELVLTVSAQEATSYLRRTLADDISDLTLWFTADTVHLYAAVGAEQRPLQAAAVLEIDAARLRLRLSRVSYAGRELPRPVLRLAERAVNDVIEDLALGIDWREATVTADGVSLYGRWE